MSDWFKDWFASEEYLNVYCHRDKSEAEGFINVILSKINLKEKSLVLDAACGAGRHSFVLAKKGFKVLSFDLSPTLIKLAQKNVGEYDNVLCFRADIRSVGLKPGFDAVFNLFTSFGYFDNDEENFAFVKNAYDLLKFDGAFIFDYFNSNFVRNNLIPFSEKRLGEKIIYERRKIDNGRVIKEIEVYSEYRREKFFESVMLYSPDEIISRFVDIGFKPETVLGNYEGDDFDFEKSNRLIIIFKK